MISPRFVPGYYVESVKLGEREVMGKPVDLTGGAVPFRVTYRSDAGRIQATVEKGGGSTVLVLAQDQDFVEGQFIRTAKCDAEGRQASRLILRLATDLRQRLAAHPL